jgi:hypothetical protein
MGLLLGGGRPLLRQLAASRIDAARRVVKRAGAAVQRDLAENCRCG